MTISVDCTGAGLIWRDHEGRQAASITLASNDDGGTLIVAGTIPPESDLNRECLQHLADLFPPRALPGACRSGRSPGASPRPAPSVLALHRRRADPRHQERPMLYQTEEGISARIAFDEPMIDRTAEIVMAYVGRNPVPQSDLPALIASVHKAVCGLSAAPAAPAVTTKTQAEIDASVTREHIFSFEDGKPYKTLRRHLTCLGLSPEAYRAKHGLPAGYPMVSAEYSAHRSDLAKSYGLGRGGRIASTLRSVA